MYRGFSVTLPAAMQIYWNIRKRLHKKRVQLVQDLFGIPTWPPFHCFGTLIWSYTGMKIQAVFSVLIKHLRQFQ